MPVWPAPRQARRGVLKRGRVRANTVQITPPHAANAASEPDARAARQAPAGGGAPSRPPQQRPAAHAVLHDQLEACMDELPDRYRTVFMLRTVDGMSMGEIARMLRLSGATVRVRFFRARMLLRKILAARTRTAMSDAFAFDGERCDRIVAGVLARARQRGPIRDHRG